MFCPLHLSLCRLLPKHDVMFPRRMWGWQVQHWFIHEVTETCGDKKHPPLSPLRSVLKTYDSTNFSYQFSSKMSSKWYRNDCFCHSCDSWGRPDVCWLKIMSLKRYISRNGNTKLNREKMDPGNQIKGKSFLKQKKAWFLWQMNQKGELGDAMAETWCPLLILFWRLSYSYFSYTHHTHACAPSLF